MEYLLHPGAHQFLALAVILFFCGVLTAMIRKNALIIVIGIELMFCGAAAACAAFSAITGDAAGQVLALFVLIIAAAYGAFGLAIIVAVKRNRPTIYVEDLNELKH